MKESMQAEALELPGEILASLVQDGNVKKYQVGELILQEEDHIRSIPVVRSGVMKVLRTEEDGREILLYHLQPGEGCLMSILGGLTHNRSKIKAEVVEDAEILFVPIEKFSALMRHNPQLLDYVFNLYHKRFEELLSMVNEVTFKKTDSRLMSLLKKKSALNGSKTLQVTHEQLAGELGTARVVVSRILKGLEEEGALKLGRNKITLL